MEKGFKMSEEQDIKERKRRRAKHKKKNKVKPCEDLNQEQQQLFWNR